MTPEWTTDEFGTRRWHHEGWTITVWTFSGVDCDGPDGSDLDYDEATGVVGIGFQAPYDGSVRATVPWVVLETYIKTCQEAA